MKLGLGIDTGGTYTDSVVMDLDTHEILCRSKALTTHDDLISGIMSSIKGLNDIGNISIVALSSTLATNSVVEGKSCRVGLIIIGKEIGRRAETSEYAFVNGAFDMRGNECTPLDLDAARSALESMKGRIDALAVAGYLSVRYPAHENAVRALAKEIVDVPVICAHDLTSKLGFEQRVNTAVINAGLIPTVIDLMESVSKALSELSVDAPLMMVRGDGSLMNAETARTRPVETILSGPASSLNSAMFDSGLKDALIVDIGGTTTDIGMIRGGFIHTLDDGAVIGGHRTRVRAADVSTFGIGGDSGIEFIEGEPVLSSVRVIPVCVASSQWPDLRGRMISGGFCIRSFNRNTDNLPESERRFVEHLGHEPVSISGTLEGLGIRNDGCDIARLESEGYLLRIGLTPTDMLAADGKYDEYDHEASYEAVLAVAGGDASAAESMIISAQEAVVRKIADSVKEHCTRISEEKDHILDRTRSGSMCYDMSDVGSLPIVGIGAPAGAWLPKVAETLGVDLILPDNFDVANAKGAVSSSVTEYVEIAVRASPMDFSPEPECRVYIGEDSSLVKGREASISFSEEQGRRLAIERAVSSGAVDITTDSRIDEYYLDTMMNGVKLFRGADIIVRATGRPNTVGH